MTTPITSPDHNHSDAQLVRSARQGDADAFAALYEANRARIYSLCLRMTSNTAEAEDLTQEAFLQAFRKLDSFRGDSAVSTWLFRVAINTVLMHFRKEGRRQISIEEPVYHNNDSNEATSLKREHGSVDRRLDSSIDRLTLTRALAELPGGYRTIFLLHEVNGYGHHEIARLRSCSVGNSKSQLHKAKSKMRKLLGVERLGINLGIKRTRKQTVTQLASGAAVEVGIGLLPRL